MSHIEAAAEYLSPAAVTEHLRERGIELGERTIYRAIEEGTLPAVRAAGRKLYVKVADVDKLLTPVAESSSGDAA